MDYKKLKKILRDDEGLRLNRYLCTAGRETIGYGHAHGVIPEVCTLEQAEHWLDEDAAQAEHDARELCPVFDDLTENRQIVLTCMAFQLGRVGLSKFRIFLSAVKIGEYAGAVQAMRNSLWYRQTPNRAKRLIAMMRVG